MSPLSRRPPSRKQHPAVFAASFGTGSTEAIEVRPRHTYVSGGDIALLIVDWVIEGTGPAGEPVHVEGTATDVARRGPDGTWRYVIDNPFGTARPAADRPGAHRRAPIG